MYQNDESKLDHWLTTKDLRPNGESWTLSFTMSNAPIENWFYRRNLLEPEDLKLQLIIPQWGLWVAQLDRRDEVFCAQWRPKGDFRVESQQMRYRRLLKWPAMERLDDFPRLVGQLEQVLEVTFLRHVNVGYRSVDVSTAFKEGSRMREWFKPCADSIGRHMHT